MLEPTKSRAIRMLDMPEQKVEFDEGKVKAATPEGILETLISTGYAKRDNEFGSVIVLTYRYFIEPFHFLTFLTEQFQASENDYTRQRYEYKYCIG
jgi:hypothetical protein